MKTEDVVHGQIFFQDMLFIQGIGNHVTVEVRPAFGPTLSQNMMDFRKQEFSDFLGAESAFLADDNFFVSSLAVFFVTRYNISDNIPMYIYNSEYEPIGTAPYSPNYSVSPYNALNGSMLKLVPDIGVEAQGNLNPQSAFVNHALVKYFYSDGSSAYFDPSYGLAIMDNQNDWENAAIAGFGSYGTNFLELGNPTIIRRIMWIYETNTPQLQCFFSN